MVGANYRCSQVNQQIALKTIKKQGFTVNAVWNGKEALDYLIDAKEGKRDRPDIILMDVQMPIMDGYSATHTIRTEPPFKDTPDIRDIPIVAMTASAIQGDKEKCHEAGMDDYLAKPVRGKLLEKMLVKWAVHAKRKHQKHAQGAVAERAGKEGAHAVPDTIQEGKPDTTDRSKLPPNPSASAPPGPTTDAVDFGAPNNGDPLGPALESISYRESATMHKSTETEGDRVERRAQAEETAADLRDRKLIESSDDPRSQSQTRPQPTKQNSHEMRGVPSHALTKENMDKLVEEQEDGRRGKSDGGSTGESPRGRARKERATDGKSSLSKGVRIALERSQNARTPAPSSMNVEMEREEGRASQPPPKR